jgi:hypothetical protein
MSVPTLYLHIGFPKTGSTHFQQAILPELPGMTYFDRPSSSIIQQKAPWDGVLNRLFECSPQVWSRFGRSIFNELFGSPTDNAQRAHDVLISDENMWISGARDPYLVQRHLQRMMDLASEWGFARIRIIAIFRRQDTWMASAYAQTSDQYRGASQRDFEQRVRRRLDPSREYFDTRVDLDYSLQYRLLCDCLGSENVLFLPYELMKDDMEGFYRHWFDFIGLKMNSSMGSLLNKASTAKHNVRSSGKATWALRERTTRNVPFVWLRPGRLFSLMGVQPPKLYLRLPDLHRGNEISLTPELSRHILSRYRESNRQLNSKIATDLDQYGYLI